MTAAPEGGGGGFGYLEPPLITGSAVGGGAGDVAFPRIICVTNLWWGMFLVQCE